tara:strand:- start:10515 stop:10739 length:225 start_codon:yes stop_codon:yes gene_type:complete
MNFKKLRKTALKLNKNGMVTGLALILIAFLQIPIAIKNTAEIFCIGQASNKIWRLEKNHSEANMIAIQRCNGNK